MRTSAFLCSTALTLWALTPHGAAQSQAAAPRPAEQPIKLQIGGYFMIYLLGADQERAKGKPGQDVRSHGITRESEVAFLGSAQLDNGLVAGVRIELEGETSADQIDESWIYFSHPTWGRLEAGQTNSAAYRLWKGALNPVPGFGFNDRVFLTVNTGTNRANPGTVVVFGSGDEEKLSYFTPQIYGFQFGVSYTPNGCEAAFGVANSCAPPGSGLQSKQNLGRVSETVELGLNFTRAFGEYSFGAYAGGGFGEREDVPSSPFNSSFRDQEQWGLGAILTMGGLSIGTSYLWNNNGLRRGPNPQAANPLNLAATTQEDFNFGIAYQSGRWTYAGQYHRTWVGLTDPAGERAGRKDKMDGLLLGVRYTLHRGVMLVGGVEWRNYRGPDRTPATSNNDAENNGITLIVGTRLDF